MADTMPADHHPGHHDVSAWRSSSIVVHRSDRSVVVKVLGGLDHIAAAGLRHILTELVDGQGNVFVRVEYDVLAEASVFATVSTLEPLSTETPREAGVGFETPRVQDGPDQATHDSFEVQVVDCWGAVHVDLIGELDLSETDAVAAAIEQIVAAHPTPCAVAFDLGGITFIDLHGVRALAAAGASLLSRGFRLSLRSVGPMVEKVAERANVHFHTGCE